MKLSRLQKTNSIILFVILLLLVLIAGTSVGRSTVNVLLHPLRRFVVAPVSYNESLEDEALRAENKQLRQQLGALSEEHATVRERRNAVTVEVVSYSPHAERNAIIVDVGSEDGITEGATAVSQGFFIGEVITVDQSTSTIALINDGSFRAVGETEHKTQGILTGAYNSITLRRIPRDAELTEGDMVYTSKLDTEVVGDLPVGRVQAIFREGELLKYAQIRSPVDFTKLTAVSIIR